MKNITIQKEAPPGQILADYRVTMVIWHSKDRDEVYKKARERKLRHSAILYTGLMPEDAAIIL